MLWVSPHLAPGTIRRAHEPLELTLTTARTCRVSRPEKRDDTPRISSSKIVQTLAVEILGEDIIWAIISVDADSEKMEPPCQQLEGTTPQASLTELFTSCQEDNTDRENLPSSRQSSSQFSLEKKTNSLLTFCYLAALNCWLLLCPAILSHDWQMGSVPLVTSFTDTRNLATCIFFGGCLVLTYKAFTDFEVSKI
ncbi:Transmembrane and TPR repeat-containing protein 2 [Trachymyrmex septentrionalis]|uniref:Transmembrane and TPR repeat-containing protein 2 n=1 Tax=Trachymyrmex septentrionalis TaxID=34720 RepID=A0A195EVU7_9HYME|nr:Transmembrane and TPR repeat-containing protein 2 [Trachymyrmex septentrionalis]